MANKNDIQLEIGLVINQDMSLDDMKKALKDIEKQLGEQGVKVKFDVDKQSMEDLDKALEKQVTKTPLKVKLSVEDAIKEAIKMGGTIEDVGNKLRELENFKKLKNLFDSDGNLTGLALQLEDVKDGMKELNTFNIIGKMNDETSEWEYSLKNIERVLTDTTKQAKKAGQDLSEAFVVSDYQKGIDNIVDDYKNGVMDIEKFIRSMRARLSKKDKFETLDVDSQNKYNNILKETISDLEQIRLKEKQIAQFKREMTNKADKVTSTNKVDTAELKQWKKEVKAVDVSTENLSQVMSLLRGQITLIEQEGTKAFKNTSHAMTPYEQNIRSLMNQVDLGVISLEQFSNKLREVMYNDDKSTLNGNFANLDMGVQVEFMTRLTSAQQKLNKEKKEEEALDRRKEDFYTRIKSKVADLNNIQMKNPNGDKDQFANLVGDYKKLEQAVRSGNKTLEEARVDFNKLSVAVKDYRTEAQRASGTTNAFGDAMKRFAAFYSLYDILNLGKRAISSMVETIFELDDALVELQKVSDLSGESLEGFTEKAYKLGEEISKSGSDVIKASTEFAKAGFGEEELLDLAEASLVLTSIGDGMTDIGESAGTLIAVMKGFGKTKDDVTHIMDAINNVSNNASVNFSDLTMALQRMSGTMNSAGVSMEESIGMFTAINEVLRNTEMTSTALNTLSMRIRGLGEDGEAIDGLAPKLQGLYKDMADVDLTNQNGQLRNMYDILSDLAPKWAGLTDNQRQYMAQETAGVRQSKAFLILMDNFSRAIETTGMAYESTGSAMEEYSKWQDSLEGKVNNLKSAMEQLATTTINSDTVKGIIDLATEVVKLTDAMGGLVPIVTALTGAFIIFKASSITTFLSSAFTTLTGTLTKFGATVGLVATGSMSLSGALTVLAPALTTVGGALGAVTLAVGAGMAAWNLYQKAQEEAAQAQAETIEATREQMMSQSQQIQTYKELYETRDKNVEKVDELLKLQAQLTDSFGLEKDRLDLVNGSYKDNIALLKEQLEIKAKILNKENEVSVDSAIQKVDRYANKGILVNPVDKKMLQENWGNLSQQVQDAFAIEGTRFKIKPELELDSKQIKQLTEQLYAELYEIDDFMGSSLRFNLGNYVQMFRENFGLLDTEIERAANDMVESLKAMYGITEPLETTPETFKALQQSFEQMAVGYDGVATKTEVTRLAAEKIDQQFTQFTQTVREAEREAAKMGGKIFDLTGPFQEAMDKTFSLSQAMNELTKTNNLSEVSIKALAKQYPELLEYMDNRVALETKLGELLLIEETEQYTDKLDLLNKSINSLNDGQTLTGETLTKLLQDYPELRDEVEMVNGVYTLSTEVLEGLRDMTVEEAQTFLNSQAEKTNSQLENTRIRIESMKEELVALQSLSEAYAIAAGAAAREMVFNRNPFDKAGKQQSAQDSIEALQNKAKTDKQIAAYEKAVADSEERAKALEEKALAINGRLQNVSIAGSTGNTKKGSNISNKKGADPKKEIDKQFNEAIQRIKDRSLDLEREIQQIQNRISLAQAKGNVTEETRLEKEMVKLLERKKLMQNSQADELRGLKTKYTEKEKQAKLDEEIFNLSSGWWDTRKEQLEQEIDLIQQKYDLEKLALDNRIKDIELSQTLLNSSSEEYIRKEQEKYKITQELQEMAYKQIQELRAKGLEDTSDEIKSLLDLWHSYESNKLNIIKSLAEQQKKVEIDRVKNELDEVKKKEKAFKDLHEMVINMIKKETQDKIDALEKEKNAYKKVIDAKKKALQEEKNDRDYNKGLEERKKKIEDLEKELANAQFDTSEEGKAKRLQLEEELKKAREEMEDYQYDRTMEKTEEALDKEYEDYSETKDKEIEKLKDYLSKEGKIREEALKMIESKNKSLYDKLMKWNLDYGTGVATDVVNAWDLGTKAMELYGNTQDGVLGVLREMTNEMERLTELQKQLSGGTYDGDFNNAAIGQIDPKEQAMRENVAKMKLNAEKWKSTQDPNERIALSQENEAIGQQLGATKDANGVWWIYKNGRKVRLFDVYHTGARAGFVGGDQPSLKSNEVFAKLLKRELVLTPRQMDTFMRDTLPSLMGYGGGGVTIDKFIELVVEGNLDPSVDIERIIDKASTQAIEKLKKALFNKGKFRGANLSAL